jgi:hypothetical protein
MNCSDCTRCLDDYVDGELAPAAALAVETHVGGCANCRAQLDALRTLLARTRELPRDIAPDSDLWRNLRAQIAARRGSLFARADITWADADQSPATLRWLAPLAIAATVALLASVAERNLASREAGWSVAAVAGAPRIGAQPVREDARFRVGQWLETDADSRAKVAVGNIGEVNLEPNSRLRLVGVAATDHRLELARGTLSAFIWAPPRLFFVDTPSATAVDLGCAYTLKVDDQGNGELHVSTGYVALEEGERESIIRSGMMCLTRRGQGPGTPFAVDAPEPLRAALNRFDFERGAAASALTQVLAHARPDDAVTLWHLLARTDSPQRGAVFDALAKLSPPPLGVTREGILAGSAKMRRAWAEELGLQRF